MDQEMLTLVEKHESAATWRRDAERKVPASAGLWAVTDLVAPVPETYYPSIRDRVERLCDGDAEAAERIVDQLGGARGHLTGDLDGAVDTMRGALASWTGAAADDFARYVGKVKQAFGRTEEALEAVERIQTAYAAMVAQLRKEVVELLTTATKIHEDRWFGDMVKQVFAVAGIVCGALGTATGDLLSAVIDIAGSAQSAPEAEIDDSSAANTTKAVDDALGKLCDYVDDQQRCFVRALRRVRDHVSGDQLPYVDPAPPSIITADSFDPDTFHHPSGEPAGVSHEPLVPKETRTEPGHEPPKTDIVTRLDGAD